jgi:glycosyltransferase involved in cell wall biosynthesis
MKRILYLTFFYEPDLSACSFRNTSLSVELGNQIGSREIIVDLYTSMPNRYSSFSVSADEFQKKGNVNIHRINTPKHESGFLGQIKAFYYYYKLVKRETKKVNYDLVFVSSGRFFSTFLGYLIAKRNKSPLYLDIRDIFLDTISDVVKNSFIKLFLIPILTILERIVFNYATHINLISEGFQSYFAKYNRTNYSYFTNGIDSLFINNKRSESHDKQNSEKVILYAGNIGEGQGLDKIIPEAAKMLTSKFKFVIIGDGGAKQKIVNEISRLQVDNVEIKNPMRRNLLIQEYNKADYLFIHLNNYKAFEKVLPSKIFEFATFGKPIIAGVSGYAKEFIKKNISNSIVFEPTDYITLVNVLLNSKFDSQINRDYFIKKFNREKINVEMAESILSYI